MVKLKEFNAKRKLKGAVRAVMAQKTWATMLQEAAKDKEEAGKDKEEAPTAEAPTKGTTAPRLPKKAPKRRNGSPFSRSLTFFRQFPYFV